MFLYSVFDRRLKDQKILTRLSVSAKELASEGIGFFMNKMVGMTFDLNICEYTYPFGGESSWVILNCRNTHLEVHAQPKHTYWLFEAIDSS